MTAADASWPAAARALSALAFRARMACAALAGAAVAAGQPPFGYWPLVFVGGPAALWLWRAAATGARPGRDAFLTGWAFGAGHFTLALHWIVEPFLVDAASHGWMAPFALVFLCWGLALFWGAAFWAAHRLTARFGRDAPLAAAATLAAFWAAGEIARGYVLTGFPWALTSYVWSDTPVAQTSALFGPYALTAFTCFAALAVGAGGPGARRLTGAAVAACLVGAGWSWGAARLAGAPADAGPDAPLIRVLQTAVEQNEKWAPENVRPNFDMLLDLSETEPGAAAPALIVWPESAVTFLLYRDEDALAEIADRAGGAEVATGALRHANGPRAEVTPGSRWRNSLFLVRADGSLAPPFDKVHLVPFGEYMPFDEFFISLGVVGFGSLGGGLVAGDDNMIVTPASGPAFAPLICYEMIFPGETMAASEGADWMILVTNDSWFGGGAGLIQHLAKARMRAIETGRPIARSANAGVSALIDPYGRTPGAHPPGVAGVVERRLPAPVATTYRDIGETGAAVLLLLLLAASTKITSRRRAA